MIGMLRRVSVLQAVLQVPVVAILWAQGGATPRVHAHQGEWEGDCMVSTTLVSGFTVYGFVGLEVFKFKP
jgi:hypothetical protein